MGKKIIIDYIEASYWHLPKQYAQERFIGKSIDERFMACIEYRGLESFMRYISKYIDK